MSARLTKKTKLNNLDGGKLYKVNADYSECEDLDDKEIACSKVISKIIDKLGELEDIEEELGCDVGILFKALNQECVWIKDKDDGSLFDTSCEIAINKDEDGFYIDFDVIHEGHYHLKDYGKTWALTKEELL